MKHLALLLLAALAFSVSACSTASKKECCASGSSCSTEGAKHKH